MSDDNIILNPLDAALIELRERAVNSLLGTPLSTSEYVPRGTAIKLRQPSQPATFTLPDDLPTAQRFEWKSWAFGAHYSTKPRDFRTNRHLADWQLDKLKDRRRSTHSRAFSAALVGALKLIQLEVEMARVRAGWILPLTVV
jgi:hypothetical protein